MQLLTLWLDSRCPLAGTCTASAALVLLLYFAFLAFAGALVPGPVILGTPLSDNKRLPYRCNGFAVLWLLVGAYWGLSYLGWFPLTIIADMGGELFATTTTMTALGAVVLYCVGRASKSQSPSFKPSTEGNLLLDLWLGVQLNPQFLGVDLKFFSTRAGMMGWLMINLSVAAKEWEQTGQLGLSMILYQLFTGLYVLDYFWYEEYMTSTWDIIAERFGFMLLFGDLVWIPFVFSVQAWWLLAHPIELSALAAVVVTAVFVLGYAIFRGTNVQKHVFKHNPKAPIWGKQPEVVGGKLLVSGYWGWSRHCNYFGDILLALSYSMPCGFGSWIPYVYPIYLTILLLQRERRDEARCRQKYGKVWVEYCKRVPWRIVPFVY